MADYAISNVARRVVYTNTGVGPYSFTFEILANTDIAVYRGSTLLTLTTDYSVTINANGTGSVTLVVAGTGNITIVGARAIQRTSDYTTGGDLFASTLNTDLDSQTIYAQQVAETAERGLKAPVIDPTDINMTLPAKATRVGTVLAFNATTGNPEAGPSIASLATVAAQSANINTVATNIASVNTVAGISANVTTVAGVSGNVTTVAGSISNVNTVADDLNEGVSEINTVAVNIADVNTVGTNIANVNTVAGISANVTTVAGISANVTIAATNVADINNFADVYQGAKATDPTLRNDGSALQSGDLYFNTADDVMKVREAGAWLAAFASLSGALLATNNLSDLTNNSTARSSLGLGSIATQDSSNVTITGGSINGTAVGASTASTGKFTTLDATGNVNLDGGSFVFNEAGADKDARFEGDTNANLLFLDASADKIGIGTNSPQVLTHIQSTTATTNAVTQALRIDSQSSGTPANGIGVGIEFATETAASNTEIGATIEAITTDVTSTSEDFDLSFKTMAAGATAAERMRVTSTGDFKFDSGYGSVATAYGCRAWVNFNGTGTVAIRASGNVSSITDNGTGDYTVNFTTAIIDANYNVNGALGGSTIQAIDIGNLSTVAPTTTTLQFLSRGTTTGTPTDATYANISIFR